MTRDATTMTTLDRRHMRSPHRSASALAAVIAAVGVLLLPALASAHPLGNFTINHYAGIRVEAVRIVLDVVIDQAEIPTFQARLGFDTDGDGEVSDAEADAGRSTACDALRPSLALTVAGAAQTLDLDEAGLFFPPGVGGLSTMRMVCEFQATLAVPIAAATPITFADTSFVDRLGWREIVVTGSGVTLSGTDGKLRATTDSARLTRYPTNLLTQALADAAVSMTAAPGGPTLTPLEITDATPVAGVVVDPVATHAPSSPTSGAGTVAVVTGAGSAGAGSAGTAPAAAVAGSVPGGVSVGDLPSIFRSTDLSPIVLLVSILTAAALGAGHALTPGHGKTLMAAYLVGTRGTALHAAGLGLSVTLSHTLGILVLAALVVGAGGILPPDVVVRAAPMIAAVSIVLIGGWMLMGEGRRRWRARAAAQAVAAHGHAHDHGEAHDHAEAHDHEPHPHDHSHPHPTAPGEHSHGGVAHSHLPPAGTTISWRSLFVLGLAGGLIPSTSALLILLGSIAAGRPAFGFILVVAFGLGMALVMGGIGFALVLARGRLDRVDSTSRLWRVSGFVPLAAACLVFGLGLYLTVQAVAGTATF